MKLKPNLKNPVWAMRDLNAATCTCQHTNTFKNNMITLKNHVPLCLAELIAPCPDAILTDDGGR